ncbi:hypothetical protein CGRA01v4_05198 [Colletotrichum graminicola]|nr:hypothetical protein CGRA01v4_05198 [Colletotrichum graminicola]
MLRQPPRLASRHSSTHTQTPPPHRPRIVFLAIFPSSPSLSFLALWRRKRRVSPHLVTLLASGSRSTTCRPACCDLALDPFAPPLAPQPPINAWSRFLYGGRLVHVLSCFPYTIDPDAPLHRLLVLMRGIYIQDEDQRGG